MTYHGFVEGDDLGKGTVDVVVTEGFTGNIALKTAEGTARQIGEYLRAAMSRSLMAKIGYLFARGAFAALKGKMDPRKVNGGVFLGLEGIVIKSHGGTDAIGFASAAELGYEMARENLMAKVREMVAVSARQEALCKNRRLRKRGGCAKRRGRAASGGAAVGQRPIGNSFCPFCALTSWAAAPICRNASSPTPSWPSVSIPPTNGSCSAPASASAMSRPMTSRHRCSASRRRRRRLPMPAWTLPRST